MTNTRPLSPQQHPATTLPIIMQELTCRPPAGAWRRLRSNRRRSHRQSQKSAQRNLVSTPGPRLENRVPSKNTRGLIQAG